MSESKTCNRCHCSKPAEEFSPASGGNYRRSTCRECEKELVAERKALREKIMDPPEDHRCPICTRNAEEAKGCGGKKVSPWTLDHCHTTGKFRGFLCHTCNRMLGSLKDDLEVLERVKKYLDRD